MQESFRPNSFDQPEFIDQQVEKAQKTGLSPEHQARLWKQVQEKLAKAEAHENRMDMLDKGFDKAYEQTETTAAYVACVPYERENRIRDKPLQKRGI